MPPKIVLNGAGSAEFTKELLADILGFEELADATIVLHDVNPERLETAEAIARWTADAMGAPARIESYLDRRAALDGADHVVSMIRVGGHEGLRLDFEVPARRGVRQTMADTMGIGSIFRALCTIPSLRALGEDMAELCPDTWLCTYTNPMAALVWSIYAGTPHRRVVGVCMSAQNTAEQLAELVGVPFDEVTWLSAGMNHQAWLLRFERDGRDLYPLLDAAIGGDPEGLGRRVRVEIYRRFGRFPSESSEHNADLVPWFLPHEDQIERFRIPVDEYLRRSERNLAAYDEVRRKLNAGEPLGIERGPEYAPQIIHSIETSTPRTVYGNVRNGGSIENLPSDACVEVPCLVDRAGVRPTSVGALPPGPLALNRLYVNVCELTVRAALEGSRSLVYQAALMDPATASALPTDEIVTLCDELIEAHADYLPDSIVRG
ncbi:MAG TPA: alpha-glucosidase/alpha-galactosidase [Actinomycetota bacterium]